MSLCDQAKKIIANFPLGFLATIDAQGLPAVSPKGTFLVLDEMTLGFANIRSPGSIANLRCNPACEINFADVFTRIAVRAGGEAEILARNSPGFSELMPKWEAVWPSLAPRINAIVRIKLSSAALIHTPPYDDGATQEEMIALYKHKYAEIYP